MEEFVATPTPQVPGHELGEPRASASAPAETVGPPELVRLRYLDERPIFPVDAWL